MRDETGRQPAIIFTIYACAAAGQPCEKVLPAACASHRWWHGISSFLNNKIFILESWNPNLNLNLNFLNEWNVNNPYDYYMYY